MASTAAGVKADRPSFAKIAASGLKPPSKKANLPSHTNTQHENMTSSQEDGSNIASHSTGIQPSQYTPKQKKLVPLMAKEQKVNDTGNTFELQVSIQNTDAGSAVPTVSRTPAGMVSSMSDEAGTQVSSSSGSGKLPSIDGKSVASGTTFTLDEKESLRPDDSASVKAGEDDDNFLGSGLPSSRLGSEDGTKAFRDQLREISRMDTTRQAESQPSLARGPSQGVLYVPPQGSGIGPMPGPNRSEPAHQLSVECPPDIKLLEALESPKDRIMVLKLEQDFVDFVKDPKEASLVLPQLNAYHRMLAHRLADYYMLGHIVEDTMAVQIFKTATCRLAPPLTAVAPPSTAASTPPPASQQMKILRRGDNVGPTIANGSNAHSKTGSENGESGNDDEKRSKYPLSREEREAKYEAARKRIMGSSKPSDTPEDIAEKDKSRSSSTAPKKTKKKQRNDSDDDFEARSAYSAYYTTPFASNGPTPSPYGYPPASHNQTGQFAHSAYAQAHPNPQQYAAAANTAWQNQSAFQQQQASPSPWMPSPQQPYDLSNDFQRAMTMQSAGTAPQQASVTAGWQAYQQPIGGQQQQQWPPQSPYASAYSSEPVQSHADTFRPSSSSSRMRDHQYAYGQLPSQTFPGRPPSSLEHPLPGSYKGKHFNPQSQSFIPNYGVQQQQAGNVQTLASQIPQINNMQYPATPAYGSPSPMQPQGFPQPGAFQQQTSYQQSTPYQQSAPVQQQAHMMAPQAQQMPTTPSSTHRTDGQPLTHPLPQPVFPRQPSPNMPLPPKPGSTPPKANDRTITGVGQVQGNTFATSQSHAVSPGSKESSIAKWGAPSSLPAKPPPSSEPFDPVRFAQNQRQSGSRIPSNSSTYGQVAAGMSANGQSVRRS